MKKIAILGSTGSIGTQTLEVVRNNPELQVVALAAGKSVEQMEQQIRYVERGSGSRLTQTCGGSSCEGCHGHGWAVRDRSDA